MPGPMLTLTAILCLGIIVAERTGFSFTLFYCSSLIFLALSLASLRKRFLFDIFISCLIFTLGAALLRNARELSARDIAKFIRYQDGQAHIVKGLVDSEPSVKNNRTSFVFKAEGIQIGNLNYASCGRILVYLKEKIDFSYGEELILRGCLSRPANIRNAFGRSYRGYLSDQGIRSVMRVKTGMDLIRLNKNKGFPPKRLAVFLKKKIEGMIFRHTSSPAAAVLDAMILGDKRHIPWFINDSMMRTGTIHILVVSGFNVGIVAFIILLFLKVIRLPRKTRLAVAVLLLIVYCFITGASNPVVRATVMAAVFLLAYLFKREPDIYNSLGLSASFILAFNPRQLFDIGFQLSFVSVFSIIFVYPKIRALLRVESLKIRPLVFLLDGCLVSFSCWLATCFPIAYYFKIFSPVTVLANLAIVPLATLVTLCGFSLIIISLTLPSLAAYFSYTEKLLVMLLLNINAFLARLPAACFDL